MSEFVWKPEDDSEVTGSVKLREVTAEERLELGTDLLSRVGDLQSKDNSKKVGAFASSLKLGIKLVNEHVVKVDLKNKENGKVYKSVNDLQGDLDAHGVLVDMANMFLERMQLGKFISRLSKGRSQQTSEATS